MSKSVPAETTTLLLGASSIAPRSPERRALKAAVERRDGAAEELAAAVKRHGDVSLRLDRERAEARRLAGKDVKDENDDDYVTPEDAEAWGITGKDFEQATTRRERKKEPVDYGDIDALVRGAAEATQKLAVTQASISVLTKALKARAIDVTQAEQRLGHAEREVAVRARRVLATGFGPLLDGLAELQAEVTRRRWGLKFLLGNAVKLNGSGGTDEAKRARALLCDGLLPAPDTPSDFDDGTEDEWKLTFEMLQRNADALLPD
jgi:hypothetical protein